MRPAYPIAARSLHRPRGKWHLLVDVRTVCDRRAVDWERKDRTMIDPRDVCANCLRDTP